MHSSIAYTAIFLVLTLAHSAPLRPAAPDAVLPRGSPAMRRSDDDVAMDQRLMMEAEGLGSKDVVQLARSVRNAREETLVMNAPVVAKKSGISFTWRRDWMKSVKTDKKSKENTTKKDDTKDSTKKDDTKKDSTKKDDPKKDSTKKDDPKKDSTKKDDSKKDSTKTDDPKKDDTKKDDTKKDDTKKDNTKKDNTKQDDTKKDEGVCNCKQFPPGNKCLDFLGPIPNEDKLFKCDVRQCGPSWRCVDSGATKKCTVQHLDTTRLNFLNFKDGHGVCNEVSHKTTKVRPLEGSKKDASKKDGSKKD